MESATTPMNCVVLEPNDTLAFRLQPQASPQAVLTIRNSSETRKIAFKVKTTRPLRYLVRPNQGMLGPNASTSIMVILQQKDCDELLRLHPSERQLSNDKFLVQSLFVDDSFYELVKTKSAKEMADELTTMWNRTDRSILANKKLRCRFVQDEEREPIERAESRTSTFERATSTVTNGAVTAHGSEDEGSSEVEVATPEQLASALLGEHKNAGTSVNDDVGPSVTAFAAAKQDVTLQEVTALRKKYDELVAFTVQLTAQRDGLLADVEKSRQQIQTLTAEAMSKAGDNGLRQRKRRPSAADDARGGAAKPGGGNDGTTFGLFHLLVCAIIFFMIGRYYK